MRPTVHICYDFVEGPHGGGNQFLKALREHFRDRGVYAENPSDADAVLFNSHNFVSPFASKGSLSELLSLRDGNHVFLHRIDGPVQAVRGNDALIDDVIYEINEKLADATVFQSEWSRQANYDAGLTPSSQYDTIINAPDPDIFYTPSNTEFDPENVSIVATSWSANWRKGFEVYKYLDKNLDFDRFSMSFFGNSPVQFENIDHFDPVPSEELADHLRNHDIFITASVKDTCSNSLLEGLHCGLPAVVRDDGGHPEIVGEAGTLFEDKTEVLDAISEVADNYHRYQSNIDVPTISDVGDRYYELIRQTYQSRGGDYSGPRQLSWLGDRRLRTTIHRYVYQWRIQRKIRTLLDRS